MRNSEVANVVGMEVTVNKKILIVEDDNELAKILEVHLSQNGFLPVRVADGISGLEKARSGEFDAMILDLMLPGLPGLDVCRTLRSEGNTVPVLILTANDEEIHRVLGLELGADDYLGKPFSIPELIARVRALFRRIDMVRKENRSDGEVEEIRCGAIVIDLHRRKVTLKGQPIELTVSEFDLLAFLAANPGRPLSRMEIIQTLWGYKLEGYEHSVNSHIKRLRDKLEEDPKNPRYLLTVWGIGYRFAEASELEAI